MKKLFNVQVALVIFSICLFACSDNAEIEKKISDPDNPSLVDEASGIKKDFKGGRDATTEVYYALNEAKLYPRTAPWSTAGPKLAKTSSIGGISSTIYEGSTAWSITDVKFGDFDGNGIFPAMITAFHHSTGYSALYRNSDPTLSSIGTNIYRGEVGEKIVAICTGDFDGNGVDELITAIDKPGNIYIYKSDGNGLGTAVIGNLNSYWKLFSMAAGDTDGDGRDELIIAANSGDGPGLFWKGNLQTFSTFGVPYYQGSWDRTIAGVAFMDLDKNGRSLVMTAFNSYSGPALYRGGRYGIGAVYYTGSSNKKIHCLSSGRDRLGDYKLITGFQTISGGYTAPFYPKEYAFYISNGFGQLGSDSGLGTIVWGPSTAKPAGAGIRYLP